LALLCDAYRMLQALTDELHARTSRLRFADPVAHVYTPLGYAQDLVRNYNTRFGAGPKEVLLWGMNPGPFGMGQTGVPFGEVSMVRDWMKLKGEVEPPKNMHPKRPIEGFACTRSEVSGKRLWGAVAKLHPKPETFFKRAFVLNYCPLLFLGETGSNVTPDKLSKEERAAIERACDPFVRDTVAYFKPKVVIGVGQYAEKRLRAVCGDSVKIACIPHPSPASPAANRGWDALAQKALADAGIEGLL
jgi:single-strand selective monofunctional uracil DNA glycosylase